MFTKDALWLAGDEMGERTARASSSRRMLLLSQTLSHMGGVAEAKGAKETSQRLRTANLELSNVQQSRPFPSP